MEGLSPHIPQENRRDGTRRTDASQAAALASQVAPDMLAPGTPPATPSGQVVRWSRGSAYLGLLQG